jgi:tRNA (guanine-N(7)-)-methyltransferase subunit TRM82
VGLGECALVVPKSSQKQPTVFRLEPPDAAQQQQQQQQPPPVGDEPAVNPLEIQAVAVAVDATDKTQLWCAVARYDKSLTLYQVPVVLVATSGATAGATSGVPGQSLPPVSIQPTLVHKTTKRTSCLTFTSVQGTLQVIIAGDLAGDAVAYSLTAGAAADTSTPTITTTTDDTMANTNNKSDNKSDNENDNENEQDADNAVQEEERNRYQRLLLGHTASMLTSVHVVTDAGACRILTADRDEKIRVSQFPDTTVIEHFLLGHEAFVCSTDVASKDGVTVCAAVSGDGTIRLWDYCAAKELASAPIPAHEGKKYLPSRVVLHPDGKQAVVIYDEGCLIDIFDQADVDTTTTTAAAPGTLCHSSRTVCSSQPLGLVMLDAETVVIVCKDQEYLQAFCIQKDSSLQAVDVAACNELNFAAVAAAATENSSIVMPATIMEKDKFGNLKMQKLAETRSSSEDKPWNNVKRKDTARERTKRAKRRKREEFEELKSKD